MLEACSEELEAAAPNYFQLAYTAVLRGTVRIEDLVKWHSLMALFLNRPYFPGDISHVPLAALLPGLLLRTPYSLPSLNINVDTIVDNIKQVGRLALAVPLPWVVTEQAETPYTIHRDLLFGIDFAEVETSSVKIPFEIDSELLFGCFVLIAPALEFSARESDEDHNYESWTLRPLHDTVAERSNWLLNSLRHVFTARFEDVEPLNIQVELTECGFTSEQQAFIWAWIHKEINFVH